MNVLVTVGRVLSVRMLWIDLYRKAIRLQFLIIYQLGKEKMSNQEAVLYKADICSARLERIFKRERPVVVVHLAAQINVRESTNNPMFDASVNIIGTINLLQLAVKYGVRKVVFASSGGAVYGEQRQFPVFGISSQLSPVPLWYQ